MFEDLLQYIQTVSPIAVYAIVFAMALIENVFPPSPSDSIILLGGSLIPLDRVGFAEVLISATAGSTIGFLIMYRVGKWSGDSILEKGKLKFIPLSAVSTVEEWFRKYGYWLIVANRFLSGSRAVVSFFAGMSELNLTKTTILCGISALAWNTILVTGGYLLGQNWELLESIAGTYSKVVTGVLIAIAVIWFIRYRMRKKKQKGEENLSA